jgi:hypothetical protein
MEFEAKFNLNSPNLFSVIKLIDVNGITGKKKADILLHCASLLSSSECIDKPQYKKSMISFSINRIRREE